MSINTNNNLSHLSYKEIIENPGLRANLPKSLQISAEVISNSNLFNLRVVFATLYEEKKISYGFPNKTNRIKASSNVFTVSSKKVETSASFLSYFKKNILLKLKSEVNPLPSEFKEAVEKINPIESTLLCGLQIMQFSKKENYYNLNIEYSNAEEMLKDMPRIQKMINGIILINSRPQVDSKFRCVKKYLEKEISSYNENIKIENRISKLAIG